MDGCSGLGFGSVWIFSVRSDIGVLCFSLMVSIVSDLVTNWLVDVTV